ncbi:MAG TPA: 4-hydroxy-tetrahydrodipicolinate synthase [Acidobacteriaceae bacterium]|jgi:4-hydroxy-tetrahydrodipicolinate synthase|nr:4-hydroxy-tetrahydrodipicolinate synthase [Acidobacteriaceae bacterium]
MEFSGCGTALVTPFQADGSLDEPALLSLVNWQIESGVHFLIPCGTTGETPALTEDEWLRVIHLVVEAAHGRVPVIAGCTHNGTHKAVSRVRKLNDIAGLSGVLTANPYYNKPMQEGQYQHFRAIAEATHLSIMLYNVPGRSGTNLLPETVARLAEIPNVVAIKECCGNLQQITQLIHMAPRDFQVFSGDDNVSLPVMAVGGAGVISVAANAIPLEMSLMTSAALHNDWPSARRIYRRIYRLIVGNFLETNPGPIKCVLAMMGRLQENYRLPMVPVQPGLRAQLERIAGELGLLSHVPTEGDIRLF